MTKKELAAKIREYDELKELLKETEAEVARLEADFKKELERKKVEELQSGERKVRWTSFVSQRFDSKGFKAAEPELYRAWMKDVESRRFSIV